MGPYFFLLQMRFEIKNLKIKKIKIAPRRDCSKAAPCVINTRIRLGFLGL
jgi:hypothetical protein